MTKEEVIKIAKQIAFYECHGRSLEDILAEYDNELRPVEHSWVEEISSMLKHPEKVCEKEDVCPKCGHRLIELEYMSGAHSWRPSFPILLHRRQYRPTALPAPISGTGL